MIGETSRRSDHDEGGSAGDPAAEIADGNPLGLDAPRMIADSSRRLTRVKSTTLRVANFQMALSLDPRKNKCL
eukprot:SAG11_NODE_2405_length_3397_cov_28.336162_2_plen_73_part_00